MNIDDFIRPDCIIENLDASSREEALEKMAGILLSKGYVKESFPAAILEREREYPSGLPMEGHKIAIPHCDSEHVNKSALLFARLARPLEFSSMGEPDEKFEVRFISMFALKEKKEIGSLLEVLIKAYSGSTVLDAVLEASSALEIYTILKNAIGSGQI